jgi:hypothetical protein
MAGVYSSDRAIKKRGWYAALKTPEEDGEVAQAKQGVCSRQNQVFHAALQQSRVHQASFTY